jgi:hypothetical protein
MGHARRTRTVFGVMTAGLVLSACGLGGSGTPTLERRRTTEAPLPTATDAAAVVQLLVDHGVPCASAQFNTPDPKAGPGGRVPANMIGATSAGLCTNDSGDLQVVVFPDTAAIPAPQGFLCRGLGQPGGIDGMKVVAEARGVNFTVTASPPVEVSKGVGPLKDLYVAISEANTKVAEAAGLDIMEFTVHCS